MNFKLLQMRIILPLYIRQPALYIYFYADCAARSLIKMLCSHQMIQFDFKFALMRSKVMSKFTQIFPIFFWSNWVSLSLPPCELLAEMPDFGWFLWYCDWAAT